MSPTRIVSWSEIDTFRQCPLKHELSYKQRWQKPAEEGGALYRGTLFHAVMENHYNRVKLIQGMSDKEVLASEGSNEYIDKIFDLLNLHNPDNQSPEQQLITWMFERYGEFYGFDDEWEIVDVEWAHDFWLPTATGSRSTFKIKVKIDLIVRHKRTGKLWIVDHKTCKDLPKEKLLQLDDQFGLYTWLMRQIGMPIAGSIHNACRTQRNQKPMELSESFKRTMLYRTDTELDTIAIEAYKSMRKAYATAEGQAERTPNVDMCGWKCPYTEDCIGSRKDKDPIGYRSRTLKLHGFEQNFTRH